MTSVLFASTASAQTGPVRATVILDIVDVRSGPTTKYPTTSTLRRGEEVTVHRDQSGWLAITPPGNSVSWINHRYLSEFGPGKNGRSNAVVLGNNVESRIGTDRQSAPLNVKQVDLPSGTIVEIVGDKLIANNSTWYPIVPPEGEFRFIPREAVAGMSPAQVATGPLNLPQDNATVSARANDNTQVPAINHPLFTRAEEAERAGQYRQAEDLYSQAAREIQRQGGDHDLVLLCFNRINRLRERPQQIQQPQPIFVAPVSTPRQPAPTQMVQNNPIQPPPPAVQQPRYPNDNQTTSSSVAQLQNSGPGYLRACGFQIDGKAAYVLENTQRGTRLYITAQSGVSLQSYVGQNVELYGPVLYRGDIRGGNYMSVSRITLLR